jgi:DNA-binding NarL/FixJ family response regulator
MRVILAEDSPLLREGLARLLSDVGIEVTQTVADGRSLLAAVAAEPPDVVITDIRMPPSFTDEGLTAAAAIRAEHADVGVLVLSQYLELEYAQRLLEPDSTRVGYLLKDRVSDVTALRDAIDRIANGETVIDAEIVRQLIAKPRMSDPLTLLTERERSVLALMAEGRSNQGIGTALHLSPKTIETHAGSIHSKLGLQDSPNENRRVLAVLRYLRG